jgi:hypothetical protein
VLGDLRLTGGTAPANLQFNQDSSKFRPKLPSLRIVSISATTESGPVACLHVLARRSDIPTKEPVALSVHSRCTSWAIKGWGVGWVVAALASSHDFAMMLEDDIDIALYVAAVGVAASSGQLKGGKPAITLALGDRVTPAGFSRLLCAARLPSGALRIGGPPFAVGDAPAEGLKLSPKHVQQLYGMSAPSLHVLHIADCTMLRDRDVAVLVNTAPGLRHVHLGGAAGLTDSTMFALLGCTQLVSVRLGGFTKVTANGVAVVLMLLKGLQELCLDGLQGGESNAVPVPRALQCMPPAAAALWAESKTAGGQCAAWRRAVA